MSRTLLAGSTRKDFYDRRETPRASSATHIYGGYTSESSEPRRPRSASQTRTRKDIDYKVSETGMSMVCVKNAHLPPYHTKTQPDVADCDMPHDVQQYALAVTRDALRAHRMERDVAKYVKRAMDAKFGICWQCLVGNEFGLRVSYVPGSYMFLVVDGQAVILYRSM